MKRLLLVLAATFLVTLSTPGAFAQQPDPYIIVDIELPHPDMVLDAGTDTGVMAVTIKVYAKDFVCVQPGEVNVELEIESGYDQFHGTSMNPRAKKFVINQGDPATTNTTLDAKDEVQPMWEIDWTEDQRPQENDTYTYFVKSRTKIEPNPACPGMPSSATEDRVSMKAIGRNRAPDAPAGDCIPEDPRPECSTETAGPQTEDSPGFDTALVLFGAAGVAYARRRRA